MKIPSLNIQASRPTSGPANKGEKQPMLRQMREEAHQTADSFAQVSGTVLGGVAGTLTGVGALYAGVLGGAAVGAALGGGIGPMVASVGSSGALDFIGTSFGTASLFVKGGMVIGGLATGLGAWKVSEKVGRTVGELPGKAVGYAFGVVKGGVNNALGIPAPLPAAELEPIVEPEKVTLSKPLQTLATAVAGVGALSGLAGGALLGAGVVAAGGLTKGLLASNLTWSAVTGGTAIGAVVGGLTMGLAGAVGGYQVVKGMKTAITTSRTAKRWLQTNAEEARLTQNSLAQDRKARGIETGVQELERLAGQHQVKLDQGKAQLQTLRDELRFARENQPAMVGVRADQIAQEEAAALPRDRQANQAKAAQLQQRDAVYQERLGDLEEAIAERSRQRLDELRTELNAPLDEREQTIVSAEERLASMKADPQVAIAEVVKVDTAPLRESIARVREEAAAATAEKDAIKEKTSADNLETQRLEADTERLQRDTKLTKVKVREARNGNS